MRTMKRTWIAPPLAIPPTYINGIGESSSNMAMLGFPREVAGVKVAAAYMVDPGLNESDETMP